MNVIVLMESTILLSSMISSFSKLVDLIPSSFEASSSFLSSFETLSTTKNERLSSNGILFPTFNETSLTPSYQKKYSIGQEPFHHSFNFSFSSFASTYNSTSKETIQSHYKTSSPSIKRFTCSSFDLYHLCDSRFESTSRVFRSETSSRSSFHPTSNLRSKPLSKKIIGTSKTLDFSSQNNPYPAVRSLVLAHGEASHVCSFLSNSTDVSSLPTFLDHGELYDVNPSFSII